MFRESDFDKLEMPSVVEFDPLSDAEEVSTGRGGIVVDDDRDDRAENAGWSMGPSADDGRKFDEDDEEEVDFDVDDEDDDDAADGEEESDADEFDDDEDFDDDLDDDDDDDDDDFDDDE